MGGEKKQERNCRINDRLPLLLPSRFLGRSFSLGGGKKDDEEQEDGKQKEEEEEEEGVVQQNLQGTLRELQETSLTIRY